MSSWIVTPRMRRLLVLFKTCTIIAELVQNAVDLSQWTILFKRMFERCSMEPILPQELGPTSFFALELR
jgi:hypothetical protein